MTNKIDCAVFTDKGKEYSREDILAVLRGIGIQTGDTIFVHSNLRSFGKIKKGMQREKYINAFIQSLLDAVGPRGTVLMPTFSYSYCKGEVFDVQSTPSAVGIMTEQFRKQSDVLRSTDAIFSVAAYGLDKNFFTDVGMDCFGKDSVFEKMYDRNGKFVFFGDPFAITYMHFVEQAVGVSYRYIKSFFGKTVNSGSEQENSFEYNVRPLDQNITYDLEKIRGYLQNRGVLESETLGSGFLSAGKAQDIYDALAEALASNPYFLLKNVPTKEKEGIEMYDLVRRLFPITRSITGNGVRQTLKIIQESIPIVLHEVPSGTEVFDWTVPPEWNIKEAYIKDEKGDTVVDFKNNNLHVVGYSVPVHKTIPLAELEGHLYSLEDQPDAIPYVTSYYQERWGFCMKHVDRVKLAEGNYTVYIDSTLEPGLLTYGELMVLGETTEEIFLSTYVCHPSMANNELSGPAVTTILAQWILSAPRRYTYRIIFIPETIGSITYLSKNLSAMKKNVIAGFNITCVGDDRIYSFLPSRRGNTLADRVALRILQDKHPDFASYSYNERGSDERQYCAPGIDLPVASVMRSKYGTYPEYHTSLDNLDVVSSRGLYGAYDVLKECIFLLECNKKYKLTCLGEPQLGKRGLYPTISSKHSTSTKQVSNMRNFIAYADGTNDLIDISALLGVPVDELYPVVEALKDVGLLVEVD